MTEGTRIPLLHVFKIVTHFLRKIATWVNPSWKSLPDPKNILFFIREYFITDFKVFMPFVNRVHGAREDSADRHGGGLDHFSRFDA